MSVEEEVVLEVVFGRRMESSKTRLIELDNHNHIHIKAVNPTHHHH